MTDTRKIEVLRFVQYKLGRKQQPTPRQAGLTEMEFPEMANAEFFRLEKLETIGVDLDNFVITELLYPALVLMEKSPNPASPIQRIESQAAPTSCKSKIARAILEVLKLALAAIFGGVVTWYLTKN